MVVRLRRLFTPLKLHVHTELKLDNSTYYTTIILIQLNIIVLTEAVCGVYIGSTSLTHSCLNCMMIGLGDRLVTE